MGDDDRRVADHDGASPLGQKVDWMTHSHQELYDMVHKGVDLNLANSAKADWTAVGKSLGEVRDLLAKALAQSSQAWEGETADRAREGLESVMKWAQNTSDHAENVATCIAEEIQHVVTAREQMPAPPPAPPLPTAVAPDAAPVAGRRLDTVAEPGFGGRTAVPREEAFTDLETVGAPAVDSVAAADATHRRAAEVMAMFQQNSYAVDRTVPSFSPPVNPVAPPPPPAGAPLPTTPAPDAGAGAPVAVTPGVNQGNSTTHKSDHRNQQHGTTPPQRAAAAGRGGAGGFGGGLGGYGAGRGVPAAPVYGGAGGGGAAGGMSGPGGSSGFVGTDHGGRPSANPGGTTSQFQAPKAVTPQHGMIGAAPMAAPPVAPTSAESGRSRPDYLEDDDNVFGLDRKAAPPVIGL
ncbi:hypothetical protein [Saccharothrix coeruleofusca]|uniref:PPE family protein n=1 Tax=Saccharothrix coeruleofusca TaxID=33919 RepID=A0A918AHL4_9PSEU|nr:hypothetical protein [Saccharothrix coeruleofusca]GGP36970.1 hypothetical protein GCM10010185_05270 [Saccharothrix coeruleofusca]